MRTRAVHIVCTIGPASRSPEVLRGLVDAGMNVARINFAHGTDAEHRENVARVRAASAEAGRPVAILQDLSGPKIRLGELVPPNVMLETGARIVLACGKDKGDALQHFYKSVFGWKMSPSPDGRHTAPRPPCGTCRRQPSAPP
jgi:pyruvate kinase